MMKKYFERVCSTRSAKAHADMVVRDMQITAGSSNPLVYWLLID